MSDFTPPSPFYRVTGKALIRDATDRLLIVQNYNGNWELPGGGWEFGESLADCVKREIYEELCVTVASVGDIAFTYRGVNPKRHFMTLRLVVPVKLVANDFILGTDIHDVRYVDRSEFEQIDFTLNEGGIADYADLIWPPSAVTLDKTAVSR